MRPERVSGSSDVGGANRQPDPADHLRQLGAFLRNRRERLTPSEIGVRSGGRRRVAGLRRDEVAALAGIGSAWYTQLEQGRGGRPSAAALDGLASALRLTDAERIHLIRLARAADDAVPATSTLAHPSETLDPASRRLIDSIGLPAFLMDRAWNVAARNAALEALLPDLTTVPIREHNALRYAFSDAWRAAVDDWALHARLAVAGYRAATSGLVSDLRVGALIDELTAASPKFSEWWADQEVWHDTHAPPQVYEHPLVGRLVLDVALMDLRGVAGLTLALYTPHDDASDAGLRRLAASAD